MFMRNLVHSFIETNANKILKKIAKFKQNPDAFLFVYYAEAAQNHTNRNTGNKWLK